MRIADILRLALTALTQQRVRTLLTTFGVAVGAFVLLLSLSIGVGVQEAIVHEFHRHGELRKIEVRAGYGKVEEHVPAGDLIIKGDMSEAKRKRIRERLVQRWVSDHGYPPTTPLTPERVREMRGWPHVTSVTPLYTDWGRALLDGRPEDVATTSATATEGRLKRRLVAGAWFGRDDDRSAVVNEFLLYEWGMASDEEVASAVGRKLRVEYHSGMSRPMMLLSLMGGNPAQIGPKQQKALEKILKKLPDMVKQANLSSEELDAVRPLLENPSAPKAAQAERVVAEELTIVGVVRGPEKDDPPSDSLIDRFRPDADVILPVATAEGMYLQNPRHADNGLQLVEMTVDDEANVPAVVDRIEATGLEQYSLVEFAKRVRTNVGLLMGAMVVLALTALLVAALGITNTLVMSVLERTHEIGVMKAVGARDRHVLGLFLVEGALIGLVGGCLGLLLGWLASFPGEAFAMSVVKRQGELHPDQSLFVFPWWLVLGVPLFAMLVTTLAALYPARRAARVHPIEALRHE